MKTSCGIFLSLISLVSLCRADVLFISPNFEVVAQSRGVFVLCVQRIPETRVSLGEWLPILSLDIATSGKVSWFLSHSEIRTDSVKVDIFVKHEKDKFLAHSSSRNFSVFVSENARSANLSLFQLDNNRELLLTSFSRHEGWTSTSLVKGFFFNGIDDAKRYFAHPEVDIGPQLQPSGKIGPGN